jgi:hypothetical protein
VPAAGAIGWEVLSGGIVGGPVETDAWPAVGEEFLVSEGGGRGGASGGVSNKE